MIESRLNELNLLRYRKFKEQRRSVFAVVVLLVATFFSFTAEFWANSKPLVIRYQGHVYVPVLFDTHPSVFGRDDITVMDYRELDMKDGDWALYPLIKWDPFESNKTVESYPSRPTRENWLGTDDRGRDVLSRLLYGFRYSITYAMLVWAACVFLSITLGGVMGYAGGWLDLAGQRLVEILNTIPYLFLLIILVSIFQPSLALLVILTSLFGWMSLAAYVRGEFLKNRKMDFVEAARAQGVGHARIVFRHILPNSLVPVITFSPFIIASHIYGLAALDYLGFGLPPPTPSWGELLQQAYKYFTVAWWLAVYPSVALFATLVLFSLVGEGVRNAFDPKKS